MHISCFKKTLSTIMCDQLTAVLFDFQYININNINITCNINITWLNKL